MHTWSFPTRLALWLPRLAAVVLLTLVTVGHPAPASAIRGSVYLPLVFSSTPEPNCPASETEAVVTYVVDGDTIDVMIGATEYRVRYIGIDTPELRGECYAAEAKAWNAALVDGRMVCLEKDVSDVDRYGRLLRYVWIGPTMVNASLVRNGYAEAVEYPPDVAYAGLFATLEAEAIASGAGLWGACAMASP